MTYRAPVDDIMFALKTAVGLDDLIASGTVGVDEDTTRAVIEEAGRFASEVLDPLNWSGDRAGSRLVDGRVETPAGWKEAYSAFAEAGWASLAADEELGGQGLPEVISMAACEIWNAANLGFGLCPLLTQGAIDALKAHGSDELKRTYLPNMASGKWAGTMNLTEPHAGSDLGQLRTKAVRQPDGTYRLSGTKIFITYGEHELTENIIHLVLARTPEAPAGTRGISLFVVPKRLVNADGTLGARNDVICASLEHKLGIHASPTCVMKYGEGGAGAVGYLVGEENRGLNSMFVMMNAARLAVGVQGVAIAERATQRAIAYAQERRQGRALRAPSDAHGASGVRAPSDAHGASGVRAPSDAHGASGARAPSDADKASGVRAPSAAAQAAGAEMSPIIEHADVRRNLMTMKAMTQAARAICLVTAAALDRAHAASDEAARKAALDRVALLTPVAKAFATDLGVEVASIGVQVHGGMGFIEETGAAQHYRDARILPIYEGTNGIQAIDLVTRKLPLEGGKVVEAYLAELKRTADEVRASNRPEFGRMGERLSEAIAALAEASRWMGKALAANPEAALAGAQPYLRLFGLAAGGVYLARGALAVVRDGAGGATSGAGPNPRIAIARFFAENHVVGATALKDTIVAGADATLMLEPEALAG